MLCVPASDALDSKSETIAIVAWETHRPEVPDHLILLSIAPVICVLLPVLNIDIGDTSDKKLELTLIEDVDEIRGDELIETSHEGIELLFDSFLDPPFCDEPMTS